MIGAGVLGRGIAQATALAGYRTILEDILPSKLRQAETELRSTAESSDLRSQRWAAALPKMEYASTVEEAARRADLVIEAVPDELESKLEIFLLLDKICKPETILASNTSTLSIEEIASVTYRPNRCIAIRFVYPVHTMSHLQLVRGSKTDEETAQACVELGRKMGMDVVLIGS